MTQDKQKKQRQQEKETPRPNLSTEAAQYLFLLRLSKIRKLNKRKLHKLGFTNAQIETLENLGHLERKQDTALGLCYYHAVLPELEQ